MIDAACAEVSRGARGAGAASAPAAVAVASSASSSRSRAMRSSCDRSHTSGHSLPVSRALGACTVTAWVVLTTRSTLRGGVFFSFTSKTGDHATCRAATSGRAGRCSMPRIASASVCRRWFSMPAGKAASCAPLPGAVSSAKRTNPASPSTRSAGFNKATLRSCPTARMLSRDHATAPGYGEGFWRSGRSIARRRGDSLPSRDARARFDTAFWTIFQSPVWRSKIARASASARVGAGLLRRLSRTPSGRVRGSSRRALACDTRAAAAMSSALMKFINSPTGPKTTHFWGPVANWGFVLAGLEQTTKPEHMISGPMTGALTVYSGLFMRFAWRVQPRNYILLACHTANGSVQVRILRRDTTHERAFAPSPEPFPATRSSDPKSFFSTFRDTTSPGGTCGAGRRRR